MNFKQSLLFSAVVHMLLMGTMILPMFIPGCGGGKGEGNNSPETHYVEILPAPADDTVPPPDTSEMEIPDPNPKPSEEPQEAADEDCGENFYGGVGIEHSWDDSGVRLVVPGYPAAKAGIQVGDKILNSQDLRGEIGTEVTIIYERNGVVTTVKTKRGKICTAKVAAEPTP